MRTMKVMRQLAVGTLFAAAAASGMTACNNGNRKNIDNILNEDRVELSQKVSNEKDLLNEVSYEANERMNKRTGEVHVSSEEAKRCGGTYYLTMYCQGVIDFYEFYHIMGHDAGLDPYDYPCLRGFDEDYANWNSGLNDLMKAKNLKGATAAQCINFLDKYVMNTARLTDGDREVYAKESIAFENMYGTENIQDIAELIAYKQCLIDMLVMGHILDENGCFEFPELIDVYNKTKKTSLESIKPL